MVTSPEKVTLPGGGDLYEYVEEMRKKAASQRTIVPVANIAEADAIAASMAAEGRPVTDDNPLCIFDVAMGEVNVKGAAGWMNTPWQALTLVNGWVPYVGGGGYYQGLRCRKKDGNLLISGMVKSGASGTIIANIPADHRASYTVTHNVNSSNTATQAFVQYINPAGDVYYTVASPTAPTFILINFTVPLN